MKPKTSHWADQAAARIVAQRGDKASYTLASGITPSGSVHVGNFREVITVDLVTRALQDLGKNARMIYSWDDFDTFRKVPKNVPDAKAFEQYLFRPISRIPDPWGQEENYSVGRIRHFEEELKFVGIRPEYKYQHKKYGAGEYAEKIRQALESKDKIREILNQHRTSPLKQDWLPTSIFCTKCESDKMESQSYAGDWSYSFHCANCGHKETVDIRKTKNLKLLWRVDWPMRWSYEQVDFEPGGKDHSSQGGSYDTGKAIVKEVWGCEPPIYLQYDMVGIKGGPGKMSSSSGNVYTLSQVFKVYEPQIVRWLFAGHRPNHDFSIAFDEDVIKMHDEFDRAEKMFFDQDSQQNKKSETARRSYELSRLDGKTPEKPLYRAPFRDLCSRLQICGGDIQRTIDRFYRQSFKDASDEHATKMRAENALYWIENYAPEEFKYRLRDTKVQLDTDSGMGEAIDSFRSLIASTELDTISAKDLNQRIYDEVIKATGVEAKPFFQSVYQKLIGRDQGPRLAAFLKEVGQEKILELV